MILTSDFTHISSFSFYSAVCLVPLYLIYAFLGGKLKGSLVLGWIVLLWSLHGLNVLSTLVSSEARALGGGLRWLADGGVVGVLPRTNFETQCLCLVAPALGTWYGLLWAFWRGRGACLDLVPL